MFFLGEKIMTSKTVAGNSKLVVFALLLCSMGTIAIAGDWPHWRGPNYNGICDETSWLTTWPESGPAVLWNATIGIGFSAVSVADGKAYAMGNADNTDTLFCFDAESGKELWKYSYAQELEPQSHEGGPQATPAVDAGKVYIMSKGAKVFCIDAKTGAEVWKKDLVQEFGIKRPRWGTSSSPVICDDLVIYNVGATGLALKKADGSVAWQSGPGPGGYSSAVPFTSGGRKCVTMAVEKEIIGLIAATGEVLWKQPWETQYSVNAADPVVIDSNTFFISSGYNHGCALMKVTGGKTELVWENKNIKNRMNASVLWQGYVYGVGEDGLFTCLDVKTGEKKWSQPGFGQGSLMIADGKLLVLSEKGKLVCAQTSPEKYTVISEAGILTGRCWTVPVLANGRIYARNAAGNLVCLDVKAK
jgi:outer membrane protein assembly factor BamB